MQAELQCPVAWLSADWAQVVIGVVGLCGLLATVLYARNAWKEAQAANKLTREQFAADMRPWCAIDMVLLEHNLKGKDATFDSVLQVTNVGRTPAFSVEHFTFDWSLTPNESGLRRALERAAKEPPPSGMTILPGQSFRYPMHWQYVNATNEYGPKTGFGHGWVSYRVQGDPTPHFTPFIFMYVFEVADGPRITFSRVDPFRISLSAN